MVPPNVAEVAGARANEKGSLPHHFFLSVSLPSPVIMLASRRLSIAN